MEGIAYIIEVRDEDKSFWWSCGHDCQWELDISKAICFSNKIGAETVMKEYMISMPHKDDFSPFISEHIFFEKETEDCCNKDESEMSLKEGLSILKLGAEKMTKELIEIINKVG